MQYSTNLTIVLCCTSSNACPFNTGIDLENIVYYKDDTHYFVMTAKKKSLLKNGVIKQVGSGSSSSYCSPKISIPIPVGN